MSYTNPTQQEIFVRRGDLAQFDEWNERAFVSLYASILSIFGFPETYLDFGSGTGAMVNMARKMGVRAYGIDVINGPEHWFISHNLEDPVHLQQTDEDKFITTNATGEDHKFDLVTCIEVAEHISESRASTLINSISRHSRQGGIVVFSSAPPGQSGEHHVNCQPANYWRDMFYDAGLSYRDDYTRKLSHIWSWVTGPLMWLGSNVQVFDS